MALLRRLIIFLLIILFFSVLAYNYPLLTGKVVLNTNTKTVYQKEAAHVDRVIDGDTIVVSGKTIGNNTHIRLLGINTPEKNQPYDIEATDYLKNEIENKTVELLGDGSNKDKYNRTLRYVFESESSEFVEVKILEQGFAATLMVDNLTYKDKLIAAENFARNNGLRLWKKSANICANCITLEKLDPKAEFFIIKNSCNFDCNMEGWFVKDDANHFFYLTSMQADEEKTYASSEAVDSNKKPVSKFTQSNLWNNEGDRFFMRDEKGSLVIFYEY